MDTENTSPPQKNSYCLVVKNMGNHIKVLSDSSQAGQQKMPPTEVSQLDDNKNFMNNFSAQ